MKRFYFNIRDGSERIHDPEGSELSSLTAAKDEAVASARELAMERILAGKNGDRHIEITDDKGRVLSVISLKSTVGL